MTVRIGGTVLLSLLGLGLAGMMYEDYVRDLFLKTPRDLSELISTGADPILGPRDNGSLFRPGFPY